ARLKMEQILLVTRQVTQEQAGLIASKQDASRRLLRLIGDGQRMVTAVRKMLKAHYGLDAEKLAEFGIQPFRGRSRRLDFAELAVPFKVCCSPGFQTWGGPRSNQGRRVYWGGTSGPHCSSSRGSR